MQGLKSRSAHLFPTLAKCFYILSTLLLLVGIVTKPSYAQIRITLPRPQNGDSGKRVIKLPSPQRGERVQKKGAARKQTAFVSQEKPQKQKPCNACARLERLEQKKELGQKLQDLDKAISEPTGLGNLNSGQASFSAQMTPAAGSPGIVVALLSLLLVGAAGAVAYVYHRTREIPKAQLSPLQSVSALASISNQVTSTVLTNQQMILLGDEEMSTSFQSLARQWNQDLIFHDMRDVVKNHPPLIPHLINSILYRHVLGQDAKTMIKRMDIVKTLSAQCGIALEYLHKLDDLHIYTATRQNALTIARLKQEVEIAELENQLAEKRNPQQKHDDIDELQRNVTKLKLLLDKAELEAKIDGIQNVITPEEEELLKRAKAENNLAQLQARKARALSQIDPDDEDMKMLVENYFNDSIARALEQLAKAL